MNGLIDIMTHKSDKDSKLKIFIKDTRPMPTEEIDVWENNSYLELAEIMDTFQFKDKSEALDILDKIILLMKYEPLSPLTGEDDEWTYLGFSDNTEYQNKRASHVFKDKDGEAYDIHGKVFIDPDGCSYTSRDSHVTVTFPYTPTTEYIHVEADENPTDDQLDQIEESPSDEIVDSPSDEITELPKPIAEDITLPVEVEYEESEYEEEPKIEIKFRTLESEEGDGGLLSHAKKELRFIDLGKSDKEEDKLMVSNILQMIASFGGQGHSGFSAGHVTGVFNGLMKKYYTEIAEWENKDEGSE